MSWGLDTPCYKCERTECEDMKTISEAIGAIHQDPNHVAKGGAGSITVNCIYSKQLKEKQSISANEVGSAEEVLGL